MIPRGARPVTHHGARLGRENGRAVQLHRSRRGGQERRQRLVVRERAMASDDVLRRFARKVGLRVGCGDERRVWGVGRERGLGDAPVGVGLHGAEDGDEEVSAFLR